MPGLPVPMPISKRPSVSTDSECASHAVLQAGRSGEAYTQVPTRSAHRPKALEGVDHVLVVGDGRMQSFGPKDAVLRKVLRTPAPLRVVSDDQRGS